MDSDRRSMYNLLQMNWEENPDLDVEDWQVENYRDLEEEELFERLAEEELYLDPDSFQELANATDSPEELTQTLLEDQEADHETFDRIYLLLFELWRRLVPERLCLSVFCDELDHLIRLYDQEQLQGSESIENTLSNLKMILDESTDEGSKPQEVFDAVSSGCANDLETFLYDFISEQIDNENVDYAADLLEAFEDYLPENKWFELLKLRVAVMTDSDEAEKLLDKLAAQALKEEDLEFNFEMLSLLIHWGEEKPFQKLVKKSAPLLKTEEDFSDLLALARDFFSFFDHEQREQKVLALIENRKTRSSEAAIDSEDSDVAALLVLCK